MEAGGRGGNLGVCLVVWWHRVPRLPMQADPQVASGEVGPLRSFLALGAIGNCLSFASAIKQL